MKNKLAVWLGVCRKRCEALFASNDAGTSLQTKSKKEGNNSAKGQFNIKLCYSSKSFTDENNKEGEIKKVPLFITTNQFLSAVENCELHP